MKKILLIDAFSTMHVGNGALIDNTYKLCKKHISEDIEILTIDLQTNEGRFPKLKEDFFSEYNGNKSRKLSFSIKLAAFYITETINEKIFSGRLSFPWNKSLKNIIDSINASDVCISLSGETINDHYRPHMYLRLLTYHLAIKKGKKFIVFPQSIGPVFLPFSKFLLRRVLGNAFAIIARDNASFSLSKSLWNGCKAKILFSPDVATTQESSPQPIPGTCEDLKIIGLTVSEIPKEEMGFNGDYLDSLIDQIKESFPPTDFQFALMPSNYKRGEISADYSKSLDAKQKLEQLGYKTTILDNCIIHPDIYQGMQKNLFAFISTRMHVGILGTSAGIPTLMINTQHKIKEYMKLIGMETFALELNELHLASERLKEITQNNQSIRNKLITENKKIRNLVENTIIDLKKSI